jgi:hypothetical protein
VAGEAAGYDTVLLAGCECDALGKEVDCEAGRPILFFFEKLPSR